jgi:RNA recognition motif-containing protein
MGYFSSGNGFVQYKHKEDAEKCLEVANDPGPNGGLMLDERVLKVTLALSKDKVAKVVKLQKEKEKEKPDNRNMALAREGCEC